jgi:16S rRNA (uracil1498-N3)-methyltransferase
MSRFYVPPASIDGKIITVTGDEAHHIRDVMRLKVSDRVVAFDGTGHEYVGVLKELGPKSVVVEIIQTRVPSGAQNFTITLIQAIPKKEKMDYIVEKATELGVFRIVPVMTERTIVDWDQKKKDSSADRWRRISLAASKQCGRLDIPSIESVRNFKETLKDKAEYNLALIAALSEDAIPLKKILSGFKSGNIVVAIGPEGDFTPDEIKMAEGAGYKLVGLGRRVLKSDTAGLAALAIIDHELSD